jgi:hypothetical protein
MFVVSFQTAMSDADIHRRNGVLDMSTHLHPKLRASPVSSGVSRLDFFSGLFLVSAATRLRNGDWRVAPGEPRPRRAFTAGTWSAADAARLLIARYRCRRGSIPLGSPLRQERAPGGGGDAAAADGGGPWAPGARAQVVATARRADHAHAHEYAIAFAWAAAGSPASTPGAPLLVMT